MQKNSIIHYFKYLLIFPLFLAINGHSQNISVKSINNPVVIDGVIEKVWRETDSISTFIQLEPQKGVISTRRTVVRSAQYDKEIYFSFVCYKDLNHPVTARIQRRDQLSTSDDIVSILLDTYNDKRTALLFQVNAIGTLTDAKITNDGKNIDFLWDTEWEAKATVTDLSWIVEISIPFKSIQYNPGSSVWGANFGRIIRKNQETAWWMPVTESYRVSQSGTLSNILSGMTRKHKLRVFPYGSLRYENSDITGNYRELIGDAGLDIQYQYSSNFVGNLTVNPDFATVEGDKEQINLTPWELRFPDKRLFFQEGNEMFDTRINTFYSRRIGDIKFGGKMNGKISKYQFNALFANTMPDTDNNIPGAWFNAVRIKRDILDASTIGFTYSDKIIDTVSFHSLSLNYVLNLGKTWKLTGQFVGSTPGSIKSHSAWFVRFARENNNYHYHIRYTNIGNNFRDNVNETGFVVDDDRHEIDSDISYRFWFHNWLKYFFLSGKNNVFWSQTGTLRSWYLTYGSRVYLSNRFSVDVYYNDEYKLLDKDYYNHFYLARLGYNTDEASYINLGYRTGVNFDRDFHLLELQTRFQLINKLSVNYELNLIRYDPDTTFESTTINVLGLDYFFTKDLWIRLFVQNNVVTE
ncbi:MAG: carbohydrate binding family 9 domain-containing protein, partial [Bacteroidales bacterium]